MNRRLVMRQLREVLRCHFVQGLSREAIAHVTGMAKGSVSNVLQRFLRAGLQWPLDPALTDSALEASRYPAVDRAESPPPGDDNFLTALATQAGKHLRPC